MKSLILAGGSGTRLWPLSRNAFPKQFLKLGANRSLLQNSVERCLRFVDADDVVLITNNEYQFHITSQLRELGVPGLDQHILLEPAARNTAPAIALGVSYACDVLGCNDDEVLFIGPSDHLIAPPDKFADLVRQAATIAAAGYICTFGIVPQHPETGFGYIQAGPPISPGAEPFQAVRPPDAKATRDAKETATTEITTATAVSPDNGKSQFPRDTTGSNGRHEVFSVHQFVEKPDLETAKKYLAAGNFLFNSGMFTFTIGTIKEELRRHCPAIGAALDLSFAEFLEKFAELPKISIDYAVLEKSDRIAVLPFAINWSDIGSWDSVYEMLPKDSQGNVTQGQVINLDTHDCMVVGNNRQVATIGLKNVMIIETSDALLVANRERSQDVRTIVERLQNSPATEELTQTHPTTYRPWGSYTVLETGPRFKLKRIVVNCGAKLSLQMHHHRSEHWIVVQGTAKVVVDDREFYFHENESAFVPKGARHRLENPGKVALEIIEVQVGEYLGEDDIIRFDDLYGR